MKMTSTTNVSAMLANALTQMSKAFTEIENQCRLEAKEERKAREETRKKCDRDLHAAIVEAEEWKQAAADAQATIASQHQTIAELQRGLKQWQDQAQNWQEHFLRVEKVRCAQSSHIEELLKLQYTGATQLDPQTPATSRTTLIRRVKAVIHVKSEESADNSVQDLSPTLVKDDASDEEDIVIQRRSSRRSRKDDDDDIGQHYAAADGNPILGSRPLRHRNAVNYQEEEEDDDDELMMGTEENHEEVYGTHRSVLDVERSKQQQPHPTKVTAPPRKTKRKLAPR